MEIRGIGIINIKDLFGVSAVRDRKKVEMVVELVEWDDRVEYDRLGIEEQKYSMLDTEVPLLVVPVRPGRNLTTIVEVAARNHLLKLQGHHSAKDFQEKLSREIAQATVTRGSATRWSELAPPLRIVLLTGMSGGGKSTAIRALEDAGWFCIDNLPVLLVPKLLELVVHGASDEVHRLALVIDAARAGSSIRRRRRWTRCGAPATGWRWSSSTRPTRR